MVKLLKNLEGSVKLYFEYSSILQSLHTKQDRRADVHERCEPGVLRPKTRLPVLSGAKVGQIVRHAKAPGWLSCCPFLSSISFGQTKEMDAGFGVKLQYLNSLLKSHGCFYYCHIFF